MKKSKKRLKFMIKIRRKKLKYINEMRIRALSSGCILSKIEKHYNDIEKQIQALEKKLEQAQNLL